MSEKPARIFNQFTFSEFVESCPEGIAYVEFDTKILDFNKGFESLTGLSKGSLKQLERLLHKNCRKLWKTTLNSFLETKKKLQFHSFWQKRATPSNGLTAAFFLSRE